MIPKTASSALLRLFVGALICAPFAASALTWEPTNRHPTALPPSAVFATAEAYWIGGRGFVASSPDGENWTTEFADPSEEILAITDWHDSIVIGTRSGKIYYRADGESTWSEASLSRFVYESVRAEDGHGFRGVLSDVPKPVNSLKNSVLEFERSEDRIVALTGDYATALVGAPSGGTTLRYPAGDSFAASTDLENWTELHEIPEGVSPKPTVFNGRYTAFAPPDHFAFGNGVFVTLGGSRSIWTSADGLSWERSEVDLPTSGLGFDRQIFFYDGHWFASGRNGSLPSLLHSTDLVNWEEIRLSQMKYIYGFAAQPGKFLVWGQTDNYSPAFYSSNDGINWREASPQAGFRYRYSDIVDGPAGFLAMEVRFSEDDGLGGRLLSADGTSWTNLTPDTDRLPWEYIPSENAGGWVFYSIPQAGIFASPDGQDWTAVWPADEPGGGNAELQSVAYLESAGKWIVLTRDESMLTSGDGFTWSGVPYQISGMPEDQQLTEVVAFDGAFYAMSESLKGTSWTLFTSVDGLSWESVEIDPGELPDAVYAFSGDSTFVGEELAIITERGKVVRLLSPDGTSRYIQPRTDDSSVSVNSISMTENGNYVVLTTNGELATGPGLQWLNIISGPFDGSIKNIGAVGNRILVFTLDAAYYPILDAEDHWTFMGRRYRDWVDTLWFGWFQEQQFPWVYHNNHGWNYQVFGEGEALWNWDLSLGTWTWTNPDAYPWIYLQSGEHAGWAYFERSSQTPHRRFFVHASQKWVAEADFQ